MRIVLIAIGFLIFGAVWATTLYRWVDKNGVVHYSDRPVPGAVKIDIRDTQTYTPKTPATAAQRASGSQTNSPAEDFSYRELTVYRPRNDEVFINTANTITVRVRVDPELQPSHMIWLYLDGKRVNGLPSTGDSFELKEVWRGTHTINAMVTDQAGKQLITSQPVTFHMRQTSVQAPRSPAAPPRPGGG